MARGEIFAGLVKDVAMHIALRPCLRQRRRHSRSRPRCQKQELLASDTLKGKPADMAEKSLTASSRNILVELCLMDQPFIKNPDQTVGQYVIKKPRSANENVVVRRFSRMQLGENKPTMADFYLGARSV